MKKFTDIQDRKRLDIKPEETEKIEFKNDKPTPLSNDLTLLQDQLEDIKPEKLDGEWEIVSIIDVTTPEETEIQTNENKIVINAELGNNSVKRGDVLYITALLNKKGTYYNQNRMGVIKVKITDIFNSLQVLNNKR